MLLTTSQHWCAIFNGAAFVILFFLMEETNFQREHLSSVEPGTSIDETQALDVPVIAATPTTQFDPEKNTSPQVNETGDSSEGSIMGISTKSYRQKIALIRKEDLHSNIPLKGMIFRPLIYFTFPIISFSGFMYGAIVCYFNILNGTASVILSSPPYNFSASMVGLAYVSCLVGVFLGQVQTRSTMTKATLTVF